MIWLVIWVLGIPVAHALDHDRTDTRLERACEAAAWPVVALLMIGVLVAGVIGLFYDALRWAAGKDGAC